MQKQNRLGRFELLDELRRDDCGEWYTARDTLSGRTVSLYKLSTNLTRYDPSLSSRLAQAVQRLTGISHPNLAQVIALEEHDGELCLITEHIPGISLWDLLRQEKTLDVGRVQQIGSDMAVALQTLDEHGITGADVRPANVMLKPDGQAVLIDAGLAYLVRSLAGRDRTHLFPAPYVAPEVARGERPSAASAAYALGIMLYEMLVGRAPFEGSDSEVIFAHLGETPPKPSQVNRRLRPEVDAIILPALAKLPEERMTLAQQRSALTRLVLPSRVRLSAPTWLGRGLGAAVLLLAVVWLGWRVWQGRGTSNAPAVVVPEGSGMVGAYEITIPGRIKPGDTLPVRLVIHTAANLDAEGLPVIPGQAPSDMANEGLFGTVALCQQLWARLEVSGLQVEGPATVSRIIRAPGAEWRWDVCCRDPELRGPQAAVIRVFVRSADSEMLLKEMHFQLQVSSGSALLSEVNLALVLGGLLLLGLMWLALRKRTGAL